MKRVHSESTSPEPPQSRFKHNPKSDLVEDLEEVELRPTMEAQPQSLSETMSTEEVEHIIRYKFKNKALLKEAFTHTSCMCSFSYERLEYVGDSVLSLLICREHYSLYPHLPPGQLTRLRAVNVDTEKLARVALRHGFHRYLRHKKPYLVEQIQDFSEAVLKYPLHSNGLIDAPKDLADVVESIIGAVFVDCNSIEVVWHVFKGLLEPLITLETIQIHPNTQLLELCQKNHMRLKFVDSWERDGTVECLIDGECVGRGTYSLRKEVAMNRAAKDALDNRWKWMEKKPYSEPLPLKNRDMENSDNEDGTSSSTSSVEVIEEPILTSLVSISYVEEELEISDTSVQGQQNVLSYETPCDETNVTLPRGQLEMHTTETVLDSGAGVGLSKGQRKRLRKMQRKNQNLMIHMNNKSHECKVI